MARAKRVGRWVKVSEWRGGRAWEDPSGRRTYYIRRAVKGVRYDLNTGCTSVASAAGHLDRFERDPQGYRASLAASAAVYLDTDRAKAFLAWSRDVKGNSPAWVAKQKHHLAWWAEKLAGLDLRRVSLRDHIVPAYQGVPDTASRVRVLKAFYGWLRKESHTIAAAEDPTFGVLSVPAAKPAQRTKSKVIPREHYLLVRDALTAPWRDALIVQAGTGWHTTEAIRFATSGAIEPLPKSMRVEHGAVGVLVCPLHKSGDTHRTAVSAEVLEAAKRLREHGPFSREWFDRAVRSACKTVKCPDGTTGIPVFTPGRFRHSVATWAFEAGADPAAVSAFLGHKSPATTKKFYASLATVPKVPTLA
jgi:integrase